MIYVSMYKFEMPHLYLFSKSRHHFKKVFLGYGKQFNELLYLAWSWVSTSAQSYKKKLFQRGFVFFFKKFIVCVQRCAGALQVCLHTMCMHNIHSSQKRALRLALQMSVSCHVGA